MDDLRASARVALDDFLGQHPDVDEHELDALLYAVQEETRGKACNKFLQDAETVQIMVGKLIRKATGEAV